MTYEDCSNGLKILLCIINTGALFVEIYTPAMGVTHSLIGPTAVFTVYILMGCQILASCFDHYGTQFFKMYSSMACICVELAFSSVVFNEVHIQEIVKDGTVHLILNGVLPIIMSIFLIADFVLLFCTFRNDRALRGNTVSNFFVAIRNRPQSNTSNASGK